MSALPPKADIGTQSWNVRFVPKADIAGLDRSPLGGAASAIIPRRCEELQCDFRKAIFSAANKAEAVSVERNVLLWKRIFMALFLGILQIIQTDSRVPKYSL